MPIDSIQGSTTTSAASAGAAAKQPEMGRDAFMKLLVTQLRHQDPLDPMDARETVTQLAELTGIEQLISIRDRMGALEVAMAGMGNTQAANLVGQTVTANADSVRIDDFGSGQVAFTLGDRAASATVTIRDASGEVIRTLDVGSASAGTQIVQWDGLNLAGDRVPAGRYQIEIEAKDADGKPVEASTRITGRVQEISYAHGYPELVIGDANVLLGDVLSISGASTTVEDGQ